MRYFHTEYFKGIINRNGATLLNLSIVIISSIFIFSCSSMLGVSDDRDFNYDRNHRNSKMPNEPGKLPSEPGKCYAKCLMQDEYETYEEELLVYTGEDFNSEGVELEKIIFRPATTNWEKKKAPNCRSADPNDCLVWCLVDEPEISEEYYIVSDTNLVKDYKVEIVSYRELAKAGGFTEWKEVVCQNDLTESLAINIQMALISKGYLTDTVLDGKIRRTTTEALVKYQKSNGLPVGSLDYETLDHLGIEI